MRKVVQLLVALSIILTGGHLFAQKYSNEFLSIGVGARAQGMGTAVIAGVSDVTAGVWNPAGLVQLSGEEGLQLGAMHSEWFGGVGKFDYLGVTMPLSNSDRRMGVSLIRFGIDEIPNTLSLYNDDGTVNFDNVTEFSAADYAFLISYAQPLNVQKGQLSLGGNIKVIHRRIGPFATAWGFGLDAGMQYRNNGWMLGVLAKDITTTFNAWSFSFTDEEKEVLAITGNEVPINSVEITKPQLLLGGARQFQFGNVGLLPELNLILTTDGQRNTLVSADPISMDIAFGLEADYRNFIFLRAGAGQFQKVTNFDGNEELRLRPSLGLGFIISRLNIDYAYTDLGSDESTYSHVVSLKLKIQPKSKE
ncbi:MAG: hypothetical protein MI974_06095 [Chitinophagales bacterium]|nr:hypothetical protein [Chitinophagales bacterium]